MRLEPDVNEHRENPRRQFETAVEAVAACRRIVDEFLAGAFEPGMSATALYDLYKSFGDDPWVAGYGPESRIGDLLCVGVCSGAV